MSLWLQNAVGYVVLGLLWLIHKLPFRLQTVLGRTLGLSLYGLARRRRRIVEINLRLCFPERSEAERQALAREHFALAGRSLLERTHVGWSSPERLSRIVKVQGETYLAEPYAAKKPVILLLPHFLGMDMPAVLAMRYNMLTLYAKQGNPVFEQVLRAGRLRFGDQKLLTRQDGIRPAIKEIRAGRPFVYLPDLDYGIQDGLFVPFFGIPAATITGLSRLAHATGAQVLMMVPRMTPTGYLIEISPPWTHFPTDDVAADTRRMNAAIEEAILTMPAQYYWLHRRFKNRPPGMPSFYDEA